MLKPGDLCRPTQDWCGSIENQTLFNTVIEILECVPGIAANYYVCWCHVSAYPGWSVPGGFKQHWSSYNLQKL